MVEALEMANEISIVKCSEDIDIALIDNYPRGLLDLRERVDLLDSKE